MGDADCEIGIDLAACFIRAKRASYKRRFLDTGGITSEAVAMFVEAGGFGCEVFGRRGPVPHLGVLGDLQGDVCATGSDKNWRMRFLHGLGVEAGVWPVGNICR